VLVDNREPPALTAELTYFRLEVENTRLKAGDFEGQYTIGEIKRCGTNNDFFNSILDRRIFNQPKRMLQTGKKCFMIVSGEPADNRWRLKPVMGTLISLVMDFHVQVITVPNNERIIAWTIKKILEKERPADTPATSKSYTYTTNFSKLTHNVTLDMLRCIPGVGLKTAKSIQKLYPTILDLTQATVTELKNVPGVGSKTASLIYNALRGGS